MSTTTLPLKSYKNSIQTSVVPVSSKLFPATTLVQAPNDDKELHPLFGDSVKVRNHRHSHSRYAAVSSKQKTDITVMYLDIYDLPPPWHPETPETYRNHRPNRYSEHLSRPQKEFKADPTPGGV
ncbi:unnamed protein product [Hymenolepis diminuta]|uniref:Uncharacterized protein n=1 Tax=Hymenolepis diminuta TaxID=6216 RepID=A0A564Y6N6_HYMDI|nr:unnamed protein product [Hymenolepis diminuta]